MANHSSIREQTEGFEFRDPTSLTNWTRCLLYADLAVTLFYSWMNWTGPVPLPVPWSAWVWGILALELIMIVVVSIWIHRANRNVRALGATGLGFSPGWAVGWYFVPIAQCWKPFQAMREIWRASASPVDWRQQPSSGLLRGWWVLCLLFLAIAFLVREPEYGRVAPVVYVPLTLVFIVIVGRVHRMQMEHYRIQLADRS